MAGIAQLVEQRTENPRVTSSNLVLGIRFINFDKFIFFNLNVSLVKSAIIFYPPLFFCSCYVFIRSKRMCNTLYIIPLRNKRLTELCLKE